MPSYPSLVGVAPLGSLPLPLCCLGLGVKSWDPGPAMALLSQRPGKEEEVKGQE